MLRDIWERMAEAFKGLTQARASPTASPVRAHIKLPTFDGTGDVLLFVAQFQEVAILGDWKMTLL